MDYGQALDAAKKGQRICRAGWNGKGMWIFLVPAWRMVSPTHHALGLEMLPFLAMKTADDKIVPWLCSQTDALASDWMVL